MKKYTSSFAILAIALCTALFALACKHSPTEQNGQSITPIQFASMKATEAELRALTFKTGLDNSKFLFNESETTGYYYAEVQAPEFKADSKTRSPLNISLVIDRSGSMQGAKLQHAKLAAQYVIDQLSSEDYVSIVQYDDAVQVVATSNKVGDKQMLKRKIDAIQAGGSTNLGGGMLEGYSQVKSTYRSGSVNRVLLLSDGLVNVGITNNEELQRIARNKNLELGITISTFGLGLDYNENLMTNIAENGSGNYYFIETPEAVSSIFQKELNGLLNVVAQNASLTIDLPAGLQLDKVFGYTYQQSGNRITINFRDIFSSETKAVLLKFAIHSNAAKYEFAGTLTYDDATTGALVPKHLDTRNILTKAAHLDDLQSGLSAEIKSQVVLFESNDQLEQAMREVDAGNYARAREITSSNAAYLESNMSYVQESKELQAQMSGNAQYKSSIETAESMDASEIKLMQKSNKSANYDMRKKR